MKNQNYILYLKDNCQTLEIIKNLLKSAGYNIRGISSDDQGIALMRKHKPDVVLLDLTDPEAKGWSLFRQIKNDASLSGIPIIDVSTRVPEAGRMVIDQQRAPSLDIERLIRSITILAAKSRISPVAA